jgi:hypothetical protein
MPVMDELSEEGGRKEDAESAVPTNRMIAEQLASHGDMLRTILSILQQGDEDESPSLAETIAALIASVGAQNQLLKGLVAAIGKLSRDLPLDLVAAIDDNLDIPRRAANGDGRPQS